MQRKAEVARPPSLGRSAPELAVREDNVRLLLIVATWPAFPENTDSLPGEPLGEELSRALVQATSPLPEAPPKFPWSSLL